MDLLSWSWYFIFVNCGCVVSCSSLVRSVKFILFDGWLYERAIATSVVRAVRDNGEGSVAIGKTL